MNKISLLCAFALLISCSAKQKTTEELEIQEVVEVEEKKPVEVAPSEMEQLVTVLASDKLAGRKTGTDGIEKAATFIAEYFKKNNVKPYFETYKDNFEVNGKPAFNIVGLVEGKDPILKNEYVILGAHYDHIGEGKEVNGDKIANGANDNAAGTAAVMAMAKYFSRLKNNKRSVIFALFSAEEIGLLGSKHMAKKLKDSGMKLYDAEF